MKLYRTVDARARRPTSVSVFFDAALLIRIARDGLLVGETDVPHRPRLGGRAKAVTLRSTTAALRDVAAFALLGPRGQPLPQESPLTPNS